ncbi:hypothetical protein [Acetobacterium sp.]|uniref:hypothetical protein n=1 Tax=Acetobacterium sp. TaxID=1872094 RepID=UPI0035933B2B
MIRKKVVLFLVEGITDQIALGAILSKLVENEQVHFEIADGDITTRNGISTKNAKEKVWSHVKIFLDKKRYTKQDLKQVIHLIDTDVLLCLILRLYQPPGQKHIILKIGFMQKTVKPLRKEIILSVKSLVACTRLLR